MRIRELMMSDQRHEEPGLRLYNGFAADSPDRHGYLPFSNQIQTFKEPFRGLCVHIEEQIRFRLNLNFKQIDDHDDGDGKAEGVSIFGTSFHDAKLDFDDTTLVHELDLFEVTDNNIKADIDFIKVTNDSIEATNNNFVMAFIMACGDLIKAYNKT